jgi:hypothetical protein
MVAGAAVLIVGAVASAFFLRSGDTAAGPAVEPSTSAPAVPAGAFTGDVDGDGTTDVVTLSRDKLRVRLASGATLAHLLQFRPRLEGLAGVGGRGLAIVVSQVGADGSREWSAWAVRSGELSSLRTHGHPASLSWVTGHRLYDGALDPLQHGSARVAVVARSWSLRGGVLAGTRAGVRCWDRTSVAPPQICAPGEDWSYDVGPHGDLPRLLPTVRPAWADRLSTTFGTGGWKLHNLDRSVDPEAAPYDLTHADHGVVHTARVPVGWAPLLFGPPVRLAGAGPAVLLSQEGGDSDTWRVYVDHGGRVLPVPVLGPLPLGGGFTKASDGQGAYYSWLTPQGRLFTRVGTSRDGRYHVYAWHPTGGSASTAPTLVARDLGTVCIDETMGTYGTCPA